MLKRHENKGVFKYSKYKEKMDFSKRKEEVSALMLPARMLGLCCEGCVYLHSSACACLGIVCIWDGAG